ncbi:proteasome activator subunit 4-like [Bidens hawaiensis]|uniref:proteasome activator subunit 4-like n=1 Tax=Bidens hawaiensis TaxID=980011 RepID=UPI004049135D
MRLKASQVHEFGWNQESSTSQSALINQAWSPDGLYLTSGSADPMIHIFDIRYNGSQPSQFIKAHKKRVFKAAWHTFILSNDEKQKIWKTVEKLLTDNQVEVREHAVAVLAGLMKGEDGELSKDFRERAYTEAMKLQKRRRHRSSSGGSSVASIHGRVLALAACVLSVPYDMPSWLPEHATLLARFVGEPSPVKSTVTKAVAEFRRTHADTWSVQKDSFSDEQLEVLVDTSSSSSYFA